MVDFINGDPDRPIITGRVYNEDSMPPWDLPGDATKWALRAAAKAAAPTTPASCSRKTRPATNLSTCTPNAT
ncbi:hypothetical protein M8494_06420 [Serratia ureilytica]